MTATTTTSPEISPQLRAAAPEDASDFFQLLLVSDREFMPAVFGPRFERAVTELFRQPNNMFSHQHTRLCVVDHRIAGMCYRFDGAIRARQATRTGLLLMRAMGLGLLRQLPALRVSDRLLGTLDARASYISNLAVHPDFQGRGLGALLMRDAERLAAQDGSRQMLLDVRRDNAAATAVYLKGGYARGSVRTLKLGERSFEYVRMEKRLGA